MLPDEVIDGEQVVDRRFRRLAHGFDGAAVVAAMLVNYRIQVRQLTIYKQFLVALAHQTKLPQTTRMVT